MIEGLLGLLGGGNLMSKIPPGLLGMAAGKSLADIPAGALGAMAGKSLGDLPAGLAGGMLGANMGDIPMGALGLVNSSPELAASTLGMGAAANLPPEQLMASAAAPTSPVAPAPSINGIPVEDLSAPLDRSLGTTQTKTPMTPQELMQLQRTMGALKPSGSNAPEVPAMAAISRGVAPQRQAAQVSTVAPTGQGAYSRMLSKMISGAYG